MSLVSDDEYVFFEVSLDRSGEHFDNVTLVYDKNGLNKVVSESANKPSVILPEPKQLKPKQIIAREDSKTTVLIWEDNSKTLVRCSEDEDFVLEFGVAMAIVKKIFGSRNGFMKFINKKVFFQDKEKRE